MNQGYFFALSSLMSHADCTYVDLFIFWPIFELFLDFLYTKGLESAPDP